MPGNGQPRRSRAWPNRPASWDVAQPWAHPTRSVRPRLRSTQQAAPPGRRFASLPLDNQHDGRRCHPQRYLCRPPRHVLHDVHDLHNPQDGHDRHDRTSTRARLRHLTYEAGPTTRESETRGAPPSIGDASGRPALPRNVALTPQVGHDKATDHDERCTERWPGAAGSTLVSPPISLSAGLDPATTVTTASSRRNSAGIDGDPVLDLPGHDDVLPVPRGGPVTSRRGRRRGHRRARVGSQGH